MDYSAVVHLHGYNFANPGKANIREIAATRMSNGSSILLHSQSRTHAKWNHYSRWVCRNVHFIPLVCNADEPDTHFYEARRELIRFLDGCTDIYVKGKQAKKIVLRILRGFNVHDLDEIACPRSDIIARNHPGEQVYKSACKYHGNIEESQQLACSLNKSRLFAHWLASLTIEDDEGINCNSGSCASGEGATNDEDIELAFAL